VKNKAKEEGGEANRNSRDVSYQSEIYEKKANLKKNAVKAE